MRRLTSAARRYFVAGGVLFSIGRRHFVAGRIFVAGRRAGVDYSRWCWHSVRTMGAGRWGVAVVRFHGPILSVVKGGWS